MNLSGGFHHAFSDYEEGFCYLNDVGVAIKKLQKEKKTDKVMIIDCDVHHGNGNASIFLNDPSVYIIDIYQQDNYPNRKIPVDAAISLKSSEGIDDEMYLSKLGQVLESSIDIFKPDLIFYLAGADPYYDDKLGKFKMTKEGLARRDNKVIKAVSERGISLTVVLAGGYSRRLEDVVDIQYNCATLLSNS